MFKRYKKENEFSSIINNKRKVDLEIYDVDQNLIAKINCDEFQMFQESYSGDFCYCIGYVIIDNSVVMKISHLIGCSNTIKEGYEKVVIGNK
jgi:hypothetical protein